MSKPDALYLLASHFAGDFPLQTEEMATQKFDNGEVRAKHVAVYTASFLPVVMASDWGKKGKVVFLLSLAGTHYTIDTRRWNEAVPIWFDQALHVIALALSCVLAEQFSGTEYSGTEPGEWVEENSTAEEIFGDRQ